MGDVSSARQEPEEIRAIRVADLRAFLVDRLRPVSSDAPVVIEDELDARDLADRVVADLLEMDRG